MKVYSAPEHITWDDSCLRDPDTLGAFARAEERYCQQLKAEMVGLGYTGPLTGEVVRFPIADGKASYMVADDGARSVFLVHMNIGDGYQIPDAHARGLRKADIVGMIDLNLRRKAKPLFGNVAQAERTDAIGRLNPTREEHAKVLLSLVHDEEEWVRVAAIARLHPVRHADVLADVARTDRSEEVRESARKRLDEAKAKAEAEALPAPGM